MNIFTKPKRQDDFKDVSHEELVIWINNLAEELANLELQITDLKKELNKIKRRSTKEIKQDVAYRDAVEALIINMDSFWSAKAVDSLQKNKPESYYEIVIKVAQNNDINDLDKINIINKLK